MRIALPKGNVRVGIAKDLLEFAIATKTSKKEASHQQTILERGRTVDVLKEGRDESAEVDATIINLAMCIVASSNQ